MNRDQRRARMKVWREANRDRLLAYSREYEATRRIRPRGPEEEEKRRLRSRKRYADNPACGRARQKEWEERNLEKTRRQGRESMRRARERLLGFSYAELMARQAGRCAICGSSESGVTRNGMALFFHADHDHATGRVRGLLCHPCNTALGLMCDNPLFLRSAAAYLESAPVADRVAEG